MNPIDIHDLARDLDHLLAGLDSHQTRGPLLVTRDGEPEAVIIRHKAYAPRLHHFDITPQNELRCLLCPPATGTFGPPLQHLGEAVTWANAHWRETHR
ncbi:hypothetical protein ACFC26_15980 [Kitasatospora purpeofusca]|uniref:hypothetical protein n=1 Tax=Kitasatospora purpeofusca TaxID=67352 RepID=UPI0035DC5F1F